MTEVMMPSAWYNHKMQFDMISAGIKTPVYNTKGLGDILGMPLPSSQTVSLPAFGGISLREVYKASGGNPLAKYDSNEMCIIMSPTIEGFSYTKTIDGQPIFELNTYNLIGAKTGYLPHTFRQNAIEAQRIALNTVRANTPSNFEVLAVKLNPLSSGRGNLAIYIRFEGGCPFSRQCYLNSGIYGMTDDGTRSDKEITIRLIPKPVISLFDENVNCIKFEIKFDGLVRNDTFSNLSTVIQNGIFDQDTSGYRLRYMKIADKNTKIVGVLQLDNQGHAPSSYGPQIESISEKLRSITFPTVNAVIIECSHVMIEH